MKEKRKIRLLIVTDYFYPHWTGIAKSMYYFIRILENIYTITVLTVQHRKNLKKEENIFSASVLREGYLFSMSRSQYSIILILRFLLIVNSYDVVFVNSPSSNILPIAIIAKIFKKRLLMLHHGDLILPEGFSNRLIEKIFDLSSFVAFSLADKVSTFSIDYSEYSRVLKRHLSKFAPLTIPVTMPNVIKDDRIVSKKLRILKAQGKILHGFAGRFVEEKGFDILFEAIPKIVQKLPNAYFVFAGQTKIPYENFYQKNIYKIKKVKDYTKFLGLLNEDALISFYKEIDFIILPSRSDCFPLVQVEAMLLKVPSIVSDIPGARVVVKETGFGLIFNKEDPDDLASKIIGAYRKRGVILKRYKKVLEFFDNRKNVEKIKEFIEN